MAAHMFFFCEVGGGSYCHERIWNNFIEIHWKSMQVMFNIFWNTLGYNSLDNPSRQHDVWRKTGSDEGKFVARYDCWILLPTKSAAVRLFLQYTI